MQGLKKCQVSFGSIFFDKNVSRIKSTVSEALREDKELDSVPFKREWEKAMLLARSAHEFTEEAFQNGKDIGMSTDFKGAIGKTAQSTSQAAMVCLTKDMTA